MMSDPADLVERSYEAGALVLTQRGNLERKAKGQYLTPPRVARLMADALGAIRHGARILEPAAGSGTLACAVIERLVAEGKPLEVWIEAYEIDGELCQAARAALRTAADQAAPHGLTIHFDVREGDFVAGSLGAIQPGLFSASDNLPGIAAQPYTHIIANPPYFKLASSDPTVQALSDWMEGGANIYTVFMALAIRLLADQGRACFIVPRSFCSGAYFGAFRKQFIERAVPISIHLLESRQDAFQADSVLQENVIVTYRRRLAGETGTQQPASVNISASPDTASIDSVTQGRPVPYARFLSRTNGELFFRLPASEFDEQVIDVVQRWQGSLGKYGLQVSTGPVVAFRADGFLTDIDAVHEKRAVPLLWMQNVKPNRVVWPAATGNKAPGIALTPESRPLLLPRANLVLVRRFSAKEEPRRLVAAPLFATDFGHDWIGLENHVNYIHRPTGELDCQEATGLAALLNSALMDRYFRIANGNTQVNAAELRALPLPPLELVKQIGSAVRSLGAHLSDDEVNSSIFEALRQAGMLPDDFPLIQETRLTMGKIQQTQDILKSMGLPRAQQNEMSALTLLVLAQLSERTPWSKATAKSLRVHDILVEIKERYKREYAENTRETIRRHVLHQFEQAGLVNRNLDEPDLATNSPRTHYAVSDACLTVLRSYKTADWASAVQTFIESQGSLVSIYQHNREQHQVPLTMADGKLIQLSPGEHNLLQVMVVNEFGPRFAPGAKLLYLGDTAHKTLIFAKADLQELGLTITRHGKLPDIVLYDKTRDRLFLIEAVTSHGPVSPKRYAELEKMLRKCRGKRIYVTAFTDIVAFRNHLTEIAWETEVWIAEMPAHLIHFNGDRFLPK
jgi:adenine-specific DNA-methyltransferase